MILCSLHLFTKYFGSVYKTDSVKIFPSEHGFLLQFPSDVGLTFAELQKNVVYLSEIR